MAAWLALGLLAAPARAALDDDPLEPFNRTMFGFNKALVQRVIEPTVRKVRPWISDHWMGRLANGYANLTEVEFVLNNLLVGDLSQAGVSAARFAINSTIGIAGLFEVAEDLGLKRRELEFAASLCHVGVKPASYIVLPVVGPTNTLSAAVLAAGLAVHLSLIAMISPGVAGIDFIIVDVGGSAAALRYATDIPGNYLDPYVVQRREYSSYVTEGCGAPDGAATEIAAE